MERYSKGLVSVINAVIPKWKINYEVKISNTRDLAIGIPLEQTDELSKAVIDLRPFGVKY